MTRFVVDAGALIHLVTLDADLARSVEGIIRTESVDALVRP